MKKFLCAILFLSICAYSFTQNNNIVGVSFVFPSQNKFIPWIKYERLIHNENSKAHFSVSILTTYDQLGDRVLIPINGNIGWRSKFRFNTGIGFVNEINFTPYPATKEERDVWEPDGGPVITYPFFVKPDISAGIAYSYKRIEFSMTSMLILTINKKFEVPDYINYSRLTLNIALFIGAGFKF